MKGNEITTTTPKVVENPLGGIHKTIIKTQRQMVPITYGNYFHIYNRGINGEALFKNSNNYTKFLSLYNNYINPIAETYSWCLMGNHIHLLLRIKDENEIRTFHEMNMLQNSSNAPQVVEKPCGGKPATWKTRKPKPSNQFAHLFNSYAQYFNKKNNRHGSLFEHPFRRKHIEDHSYLTNLLLYIHNNPVHHGFCEHLEEYPWTSYATCISTKPTKLQRETAINWFENEENFKTCHQDKIDVIEIEQWLGL